jgi:hypothetical protein
LLMQTFASASVPTSKEKVAESRAWPAALPLSTAFGGQGLGQRWRDPRMAAMTRYSAWR